MTAAVHDVCTVVHIRGLIGIISIKCIYIQRMWSFDRWSTCAKFHRFYCIFRGAAAAAAKSIESLPRLDGGSRLSGDCDLRVSVTCTTKVTIYVHGW